MLAQYILIRETLRIVVNYFLCRTRSGDYKRCGDEVIREIMVHMAINPYVMITRNGATRKKGCR